MSCSPAKLLEQLRPSDRIWVHDYQLIPLGEELRTLGVKQRMGFFLHVPFPHFEVLRALPKFAEIVRALLAYDLVGFQTETDRASPPDPLIGVAAAGPPSASFVPLSELNFER